METTKKINEKLKKILEKEQDENIVKEIGEVNLLVDNLDKEYNALSEKHVNLTKDYVKMTSFLGTKEEPSNNEKHSLTLEEIVEQVSKEK